MQWMLRWPYIFHSSISPRLRSLFSVHSAESQWHCEAIYSYIVHRSIVIKSNTREIIKIKTKTYCSPKQKKSSRWKFILYEFIEWFSIFLHLFSYLFSRVFWCCAVSSSCIHDAANITLLLATLKAVAVVAEIFRAAAQRTGCNKLMSVHIIITHHIARNIQMVP